MWPFNSKQVAIAPSPAQPSELDTTKAALAVEKAEHAKTEASLENILNEWADKTKEVVVLQNQISTYKRIADDAQKSHADAVVSAENTQNSLRTQLSIANARLDLMKSVK